MTQESLPSRNHSSRRYTAEEKEEVQELLLDLHSRRYKRDEMRDEVNKKFPDYGLSRTTCLDWLNDAIQKQQLPDPAFALKRDILLVDACIEALIPKVLAGNAQAHMALERWMNRRAKWLGLDAPEKLEAIIKQVHTGPIEEEIRVLSERLGLPPRMLENPRESPSP